VLAACYSQAHSQSRSALYHHRHHNYSFRFAAFDVILPLLEVIFPLPEVALPLPEVGLLLSEVVLPLLLEVVMLPLLDMALLLLLLLVVIALVIGLTIGAARRTSNMPNILQADSGSHTFSCRAHQTCASFDTFRAALATRAEEAMRGGGTGKSSRQKQKIMPMISKWIVASNGFR